MVLYHLWAQAYAKKLLQCAVVMQKVCSKSFDYVEEISPDPLPTKIVMKLKIFDIVNVDESKHTITLSMKVIVDWNDYRLNVNRSIDYIEK